VNLLLLVWVLTWTCPDVNTELDHFRVYAYKNPDARTDDDIDLKDVDPIAFVSASGPFEWEINLSPGRWYVIVRRWDHEEDRESAASRELTFQVLPDGTIRDEDNTAPRELVIEKRTEPKQ